MAQLRTLTVNLVDLNLQTDVINGASVEISLERTATSDSFAIVPTLSYSKTSDATGILTFRILPNNDYTRYRAKVVATSGQQVLDAFFVMPDGNRALATLLQLSVYPDGFNNTVVTTGYATQFQVNGEDVGTPDLVETLNIDMPGATKTDPDITGMASVHLPYSGQYRGPWDMSSGVYAPAAPSASQAATYTPTTMTPDGTIPGVGIPYIAGVETSALTIGTNVMQASMPMPAYTPGDTVNLHYLVLCNSSATISDVRDFIAGNTPANPTYAAIAVEASGVLAYPFVNLVIYNSGTITGGNAGAVVAGDVSYLRLDPATNNVTLQVNSTTVGPFTLDVGSFPPGDTIKLMVLTQSASSTVVFAASTVSFNLSDTTGGRSGFGTITNATLPVGALDNDWYEVSAGGYFHGKTTRTGQFVKLISGKTNLIVVDKPADPGTSSLEAVTVTHFSDINTTGLAEPRLYVVTADETNANQRTQYLYDGAALMWLVALEA